MHSTRHIEPYKTPVLHPGEAELHDRVGIDVFKQEIYNWLLLPSKGQRQHLSSQLLVKQLFWFYAKITI